MTRALLARTEHRPWPLPRRPWIMRQVWRDLLFAHWRVDAARLAALIPREIELDLFDGDAWIGAVPFHMTGIRMRGSPPLPGTSAFAELNVRTYVRHAGKRGVWFFSLDAANALAVRVARAGKLPYFDARMSCDVRGDDVTYASERTHRGAPLARFAARYSPCGDVVRARTGSLEHWLTERYCLFTCGRDGRVARLDVHHDPWSLQPARAEIAVNTMLEPLGIDAGESAPLLHFSKSLEALIWLPVRSA